MRARLCTLVALALLWSCGGAGPRSAETEPQTAPPPVTVPEPAPEPTDAGADQASEAEAAIASTLKFMAELRELPALTPVQGRELSREEMVAYVKQTLAEEVPPDVIRATNEFLYVAGVVEASFDYEQALLKVLGTELAGFYDPKQQRMYLGADLGAEEQRATLTHELVHALQDQHYGLAELTRWQPDASDRHAALHSLAEGDATSAMLDGLMFGSGRTSLDLPDELLSSQIERMQGVDSSVPSLVKRAVVAPYIDGLRFVHALRAKGGWAAVDAAWKELPSSTEQVLHPEKYFAREQPVSVPVPGPPPGSALPLLYRDVEGEQSLRLLFQEWLPRARAETSASDWAGDRLAVYADERHAAFAWTLRFDSEAAARRAFEAVKLWVSGQPVVPKFSGGVCRERDQRGPLAAAQRRDAVVVVGGPRSPRGAGATKAAAACSDARRWLGSISVE